MDAAIRFQRTYQELKLRKERRINAGIPFLAYLSGIETFFTLKVQQYSDFVSLFLAYLSGIETVMYLFILTNSVSFQRTYQELKLGTTAQSVFPTASFQRTYQELKLCKIYLAILRWQSFQRTYQELKLVQEVC